MSWDGTRPVPVRRLVREWLIFAPIMLVALWFLQGDDSSGFAGAVIGIAASLPLYLGFGYAMAKLGYQRRTLADLKTPRASTPEAPASDGDAPAARSKPAPTRRTSAGTNRPTKKRR